MIKIIANEVDNWNKNRNRNFSRLVPNVPSGERQKASPNKHDWKDPSSKVKDVDLYVNLPSIHYHGPATIRVTEQFNVKTNKSFNTIGTIKLKDKYQKIKLKPQDKPFRFNGEISPLNISHNELDEIKRELNLPHEIIYP